MHWMMPAEPSIHNNMMAWNSQSPSYLTLFQRPKESGVQLNKRLIVFTTLPLSGITISKVQTS